MQHILAIDLPMMICYIFGRQNNVSFNELLTNKDKIVIDPKIQVSFETTIYMVY